MSAPDRGGRLVDHVHATGAAKRIDAATKKAGWVDTVEAPLTNADKDILVFAADHNDWVAGIGEVAHLASGVSGAGAAIRRLVDLQLASQSAPTAPMVLTPLGRQRAAQLRGDS